ncbi:MAG: hypothetical protein K8R37_07930 [Bacteroidales bacterium]|nr:hypothetical protein [Bacteroidales bacterium]
MPRIHELNNNTILKIFVNSWHKSKISHTRKFFIAFFILNLLLSSFYIDIWINANTTSRALPIITYFESGTFQFDKYQELTCDKALIKNHYYTDKAPLPTYYVLPFFGILKYIGIITPDEKGSLFGKHIYALGGILAGSLPFTLILLIVFNKIKKNTPTISPVFLTLFPFYASFIFVFSGTYFAHLLSGILLLGSYIYLKKDKYLISGFFAGLSFLCEYNLAVIFFLWAIQLIIRTKNLKPSVYYGLGVLPSLIFILYYNYIFTGSPFEMLYRYHAFDQLHSNYGFSFPDFNSVWGLSFSWYKGIFLYSPFLLLFLVKAFKPMINKGFNLIITNYLIVPSIVYFLFVASYFGWWGGWTYGPRLLLALTILLTYEGIIYLSRQKFSKYIFWGLMAFGITCTFLAKATVAYSVPTNVVNTMLDLIIPEFIHGNFNPNNILSILFNVKPVYSFFIWIAMFAGSAIFLNCWYKKYFKFS